MRGIPISQDKVQRVRPHSQFNLLGVVGPSFGTPKQKDQKQTNSPNSFGWWTVSTISGTRSWPTKVCVPSFLLRVPILEHAAPFNNSIFHNESLFFFVSRTLHCIEKLTHFCTVQAIVRKVEPSIVKFCQRVFFFFFCALIPDEFATDFGLIQ
jgi:hypothetical protein